MIFYYAYVFIVLAVVAVCQVFLIVSQLHYIREQVFFRSAVYQRLLRLRGICYVGGVFFINYYHATIDANIDNYSYVSVGRFSPWCCGLAITTFTTRPLSW